MQRFVIGVDEAGRAPLAGPVSVSAVAVPEGLDILKAFPGVKDSKLMTPQKRQEIYTLAHKAKERGEIRFSVQFSEAKIIDELGITRAVRQATLKCIRALAPKPEGVRVMLDGLLFAPSQYERQTIIHGDALEPVISLASVIAKVSRDRLMIRFAKQYPHWGFERHKGYPTKAHYSAIEAYGLCAIHRRSFCKKFQNML